MQVRYRTTRIFYPTGYAAARIALYALGQVGAMPTLLALHLGSVLAFFLLTPFSKMAHGFYRLAALIGEAHRKAAE